MKFNYLNKLLLKILADLHSQKMTPMDARKSILDKLDTFGTAGESVWFSEDSVEKDLKQIKEQFPEVFTKFLHDEFKQGLSE